MKTILGLVSSATVSLGLGLMALTLISPLSAQAASQQVCKVTTNDVGVINGKGKTKMDAFEDAATQCYDRHEAKYKKIKGTEMDEDHGVSVIDVCANIKCG